MFTQTSVRRNIQQHSDSRQVLLGAFRKKRFACSAHVDIRAVELELPSLPNSGQRFAMLH